MKRNDGLGNFNKSFSISGRIVGSGSPTYIIADAGMAHFGNPHKARALVDLAARAGADAFKTQAFKTEALISRRCSNWFEKFLKKEVDFEFVAMMNAECQERGITFLCTAHDESVLPWLKELDVPAYKIGSGERCNVKFLREIASQGKPIILSTGMYEEVHLIEALHALSDAGTKDLALLHCVTSYPTPVAQVNLRALDRMQELFDGPVGYSDHTKGHHIALASVARAASLVEKHITLDFDVPEAQDWKVSAGPDDFEDFVLKIREVEQALGNGVKQPQSCEKEALYWATKSLVATRNLVAGTIICHQDLVAKRPGDGVAPNRCEQLIGKKLARDIPADHPILLDDVF